MAGRLVLVVGLRMGVLGMVLAEALVSALLFIGFTRVVRGLLAWRFSWPLLRGLLRYGFPRTPYALLHTARGCLAESHSRPDRRPVRGESGSARFAPRTARRAARNRSD